MENYKTCYYRLFSAITDHIEMLEKTYQSSSDEDLQRFLKPEIEALKQLQRDAEERFINIEDASAF